MVLTKGFFFRKCGDGLQKLLGGGLTGGEGKEPGVGMGPDGGGTVVVGEAITKEGYVFLGEI